MTCIMCAHTQMMKNHVFLDIVFSRNGGGRDERLGEKARDNSRKGTSPGANTHTRTRTQAHLVPDQYMPVTSCSKLWRALMGMLSKLSPPTEDALLRRFRPCWP